MLSSSLKFTKRKRLRCFRRICNLTSVIGFSFSVAATPVWIDCDTGHDDALAIMLACHNPNINLIGISCTAGNSTIDKTTLNTSRILKLIGKDNINVIKGVKKPLIVQSRTSSEIHGNSGLDIHDKNLSKEFENLLPNINDYKNINNNGGIIQIYQEIKNYYNKTNEKVTICATGCLTNIALLLTVFEDSIDKYIDKIVFLGGSINGNGNITPCAEFNVFIDPHSAFIVFHSGIKIIQIPLECSRKAVAHEKVISQIEKRLNYSPFSKFVVELLSFYRDKCFDKFGMEYPPVHDALTVAYCIDSNIFESNYFNVDVEINSGITLGQTIVDKFNVMGNEKNVLVAHDINNIEKFWEMQISALENANSFSLLKNV